MSDTTKIQWADATFNPWLGCTKVSVGCAHCYAETRDKRLHGGKHWGKDAPRSRTSTANWKGPLKWNRSGATPPRPWRVFPSLCDWLDDEVPIEWLADFLKLIHETPNLDWLLLTKRPENFHERLVLALDANAFGEDEDAVEWLSDWVDNFETPRNVWVGVSVENQEMALKRIPQLLHIPAAVRFLSVEPMLGPVDLTAVKQMVAPGFFGDCLNWHHRGDCHLGIPYATIDWVIFGGESGPRARVCDVPWIRSGVQQCQEAGVAAFVKQLGSHVTYSSRTAMPGAVAVPFVCVDRKGGNPAEWPEDLRVREFPQIGKPK